MHTNLKTVVCIARYTGYLRTSENTLGRRRYTGNYYADKLANEGQDHSTVADERFQLQFVREKILSAVIYLIESIESDLSS